MFAYIGIIGIAFCGVFVGLYGFFVVCTVFGKYPKDKCLNIEELIKETKKGKKLALLWTPFYLSVPLLGFLKLSGQSISTSLTIFSQSTCYLVLGIVIGMVGYFILATTSKTWEKGTPIVVKLFN